MFKPEFLTYNAVTFQFTKKIFTKLIWRKDNLEEIEILNEVYLNLEYYWNLNVNVGKHFVLNPNLLCKNYLVWES